MAHNIEIKRLNGIEIASFVENRLQQVAWHGLGEKVDGIMMAKDALKKCHADFEVSKQPLVALTPEIEELVEQGGFVNASVLKDLFIKDKMATMRLDENRPLGIVSKSYGIVQNEHAFDFVDMLTTGELGQKACIECAGVLGNGERVFITAKFPEPVRLAKDDDNVDMYVVFTTSHDGTGAVCCMVTPVRVVCNNTLNLAFSNNSGKLMFRHSSHVMERMDITNRENAKMAYGVLGLYNTYRKHFEESLQRLSKITLDDNQCDVILARTVMTDKVFADYVRSGYRLDIDEVPKQSQNLISDIKNSLHFGVGQDFGEKNTALWLMNGITTYYQNDKSWNSLDKKFKAITEGTVAERLNTAYSYAMKYEKAA